MATTKYLSLIGFLALLIIYFFNWLNVPVSSLANMHVDSSFIVYCDGQKLDTISVRRNLVEGKVKNGSADYFVFSHDHKVTRNTFIPFLKISEKEQLNIQLLIDTSSVDLRPLISYAKGFLSGSFSDKEYIMEFENLLLNGIGDLIFSGYNFQISSVKYVSFKKEIQIVEDEFSVNLDKIDDSCDCIGDTIEPNTIIISNYFTFGNDTKGDLDGKAFRSNNGFITLTRVHSLYATNLLLHEIFHYSGDYVKHIEDTEDCPFSIMSEHFSACNFSLHINNLPKIHNFSGRGYKFGNLVKSDMKVPFLDQEFQCNCKLEEKLIDQLLQVVDLINADMESINFNINIINHLVMALGMRLPNNSSIDNNIDVSINALGTTVELDVTRQGVYRKMIIEAYKLLRKSNADKILRYLIEENSDMTSNEIFKNKNLLATFIKLKTGQTSFDIKVDTRESSFSTKLELSNNRTVNGMGFTLSSDGVLAIKKNGRTIYEEPLRFNLVEGNFIVDPVNLSNHVSTSNEEVDDVILFVDTISSVESTFTLNYCIKLKLGSKIEITKIEISGSKESENLVEFCFANNNVPNSVLIEYNDNSLNLPVSMDISKTLNTSMFNKEDNKYIYVLNIKNSNIPRRPEETRVPNRN